MARHPPGREIYRDGSVSVYEIDGKDDKVWMSTCVRHVDSC